MSQASGRVDGLPPNFKEVCLEGETMVVCEADLWPETILPGFRN